MQPAELAQIGATIARRTAWMERFLPADDRRQIATIAAWEASRSWDGTGAQRNWVTRRANWAVVDALRTATRQPRKGRGERRPEPCELTFDPPAGGDLAVEAADRVDVRRLLDQLDPVDRIVAEMLMDGRAKCDVASTLGVHPARISQRLTRIRETFTEK